MLLRPLQWRPRRSPVRCTPWLAVMCGSPSTRWAGSSGYTEQARPAESLFCLLLDGGGRCSCRAHRSRRLESHERARVYLVDELEGTLLLAPGQDGERHPHVAVAPLGVDLGDVVAG